MTDSTLPERGATGDPRVAETDGVPVAKPPRAPRSDDRPRSVTPAAPASSVPSAERSGDRATGDKNTDAATSGPAKSDAATGAGGDDSSAARPAGSANRNRRRRGGRGRGRPGGGGPSSGIGGDDRNPEEMPEPEREGRPSVDDAEKGLVRRPEPSSGEAPKPKIGDSRPAPNPATSATGSSAAGTTTEGGGAKKRRRRGGRGRSGGGQGTSQTKNSSGAKSDSSGKGRQPVGVRSGVAQPVTALTGGDAVDLDDEVIEGRRGRNRKGRPVGRYLMAVHVQPEATHIAVLEGRSLIEHYVALPSDDISQIHGNIYLGRVQNVLPGMEAAFIDIGTPKNAVLYRGDLHFDPEDIEERDNARIEQLLRPKQTILCQVTKNPIMHKGARLTQEVSLPGRFVVLVPNSKTLGISKRLPDSERKRLRGILDKCRPAGHGVIVRTAAEGITGPEIERDLQRLVDQWSKIDALARKASAPALLYREPDMALRVIREEFSRDYRKIVIDDHAIFEDVRDYVGSVSPALTERVKFYDPASEALPLFEKHHIVEQLHRALDRKVWLPSGGSLIIEHTEALTVIDVNTGKNVGTSNLEDTVFSNNLEAAEEIARQLRLRDVGGIIVIDFVDMEVKANRAEVIKVFRDALARDKTRTQVFDISELGLVQMTRKRIGEGLLESFTHRCEACEGRGVVFEQRLLE